jgi:hypothetical protein
LTIEVGNYHNPPNALSSCAEAAKRPQSMDQLLLLARPGYVAFGEQHNEQDKEIEVESA